MTGKKLKYLEENLSLCILSTTKPTRTGLGFNQDLCGDRMATNHLSHGTASLCNVRVKSPSKPAPVMLEVIHPK